MNFKQTSLGDNIGFSTVVDEKFKTCSLFIRFFTELQPDKAPANSLASNCIAASNRDLPSIALMNEKLSSLYGASISSYSTARGDLQIINFSSSWIHDRFALENEPITAEMLKIISGCIFSQNASGGAFSEDIFKISKKELLDSIDSELNDKRTYINIKAEQLAFRGEPAANRITGTKEQVNSLTASDAYNAYLNILRTARIEIFYVAPEEDPDVAETFRKAFENIKREPEELTFNTPSPLKETPETVTEEMDVNQCKIALCFKSDSDDIYALKLVNNIFGGTVVSRLFVNVREKMSLCYYCISTFNVPKNSFIVESGVEKANIKKTCDEILRQLDDIKNGNISDSELEQTLLILDNSLSSIGNTPSSYFSWFNSCICNGKMITPEQASELYHSITKERLVEAARSIKLDSMYYMVNKESENE